MKTCVLFFNEHMDSDPDMGVRNNTLKVKLKKARDINYSGIC